MEKRVKFSNYLDKFDKEFIQNKLDDGVSIKDISTIVGIPCRRLGEMIRYFNLNYRRSKIPIEYIDDSGLFYVYRHRRLDDYSVFYIGIGNQPNYYRARTKGGRNSHWINVVKKCGFEYEILFSGLSKEDAVDCEIFLISLYGRYDLKQGNLVNKTDGGDMGCGYLVSNNQRKKISDRVKLGGNPRAKKVIDTVTKIVYNSIKESALDLNIKESTMRCYMNGQMRNKTNCVYLENYENSIVLPQENLCEKLVLNLENGVFHNSISEASDCYNIKLTTLSGYLNKKLKNKTNLKLI